MEYGANLNSKIIYGLERLSEAYKALLWEKAKRNGLSPIQIQLLLFVATHRSDLCNVTRLAAEFNVTKPTISDAVKVLISKGYLTKDHTSSDNRSFNLIVAPGGANLISKLRDYTNPLDNILKQLDQSSRAVLFEQIAALIYQLNRQGVLQVQRTCFGCQFYTARQTGHYCRLLEKQLVGEDIRLDCPEYEER